MLHCLNYYFLQWFFVTEEPIGGIGPGDNIAMAEIPTDLHMFTKAFGSLPKYKSPHKLGDLSCAMLDIADITPEDLKNTLDEEYEDD